MHVSIAPGPRIAVRSRVLSPIVTCTGKGCLKRGLNREQIAAHSLIYMIGTPSCPDPEEEKKGMLKDPIAIEPATAEQKLKPMSRVSSPKYTIEHNNKVVDVGNVAKDSRHLLDAYSQDTLR